MEEMMEVSINIMEYISDAKMREIVEEEFRHRVRQAISNYDAFENVIVNVSYELVWQAIDEATGEDVRALIAQKVPGIVAKLSEFSVFRSKDRYGQTQNSVAQDMLEDVVRECRPILRDHIAEMFAGFSRQDLSYRIRDVVDEAIEEWLRRKEADE